MSLADTRFEQMFPVLDALQLATAKHFASAAPRNFAPGELVYDVGVRHAPAWLVLDGDLEIVRRDGLHRQSSVVSLAAGQFSGEVSQLAGQGTLASAVAGPQGCTALPFDAARIRALVVGSAEIGEIVMRGTRRSCRRSLRRLGRSVGGRARPARLRRAGRRVGAHRELSRLSNGHYGYEADGTRLQSGAEIRRGDVYP